MNGSKYPKLNLKNKIIASLSCFFALILLLAHFIVIPTIKEIKSMGESIEIQREDLEKKYIKGQNLKKLTDNLKDIEPKLKLLDRIFINKNRELEFITGLENQAAENGVSQKINLSAPEKTENQNFQKTGIKIFTKGGFAEQLKYLSGIEHLSYYINAKILELSNAAAAAEDTAQNKNLNMNIEADTYWN